MGSTLRLMSQETHNDETPTLRELYPELSDEELEEARQNIRGYLTVMLRIHDRLEREREEADLTAENRDAAMDNERSDNQQLESHT